MKWLILFFLSFFAHDHAIYISVIEIDAEEKMDVRVKVFTDDMQDAIRNFSSSFQYRSDETFGEDNFSVIEQYFKIYLELRADDKLQKQQLQKVELIGESYWIYFELKNTDWDQLEVKASYFMELFPTQQQMVSIKKDGKKKLFRLNQKASSCTVSF